MVIDHVMSTTQTDQTTWIESSYNISTGQYQSSSGFIEISRIHRNIYEVKLWPEIT